MRDRTIGERVHEIRKQKRWSMHQLAERIGTTHSYISQLERGQIRPGIDLMIRLADVFGVSIDYLVGRAEPGAPTGGHKIVSEARAGYMADNGESSADTESAPENQVLAGIESDLQEIAAHDPAALEYIASMVRAIKEKAVTSRQEQPPARRSRKGKS